MNVTQGHDGKLYPATRKRDDLTRIIGLEHRLACREGLSRRQVQTRLFYRHGVRRSVGAISQDLARFECDDCAASPAPPPARPEVYEWH